MPMAWQQSRLLQHRDAVLHPLGGRQATRGFRAWGDEVGGNRANCAGIRCGDQWDYTAPAGSFGANRFGLYDVHGNMLEWVADCWNGNYEGAPAGGTARRGERASRAAQVACGPSGDRARAKRL